MKSKSNRLRGVIAGVAALAVAASLLPIAGTAQALPAGTASFSGITLSPATGTSGTTFSLAFSAPPQFCPGDATADYRWSTFITPITNDPAPMIYSASGTPTGATAPAYSNNLRDTVGTQIRAQNPGLGDGLVVAPGGLSFGTAGFASLPVGEYNVGIACTKPDASFVVQTERFWSTPLTITASAGAGPNNFTYAVGVKPAAPAITTVTPGDGTLGVAFTHAASNPVTTGYTVTAVPTSGPTVTATGSGSPITVPGLVNGTSYSVTMTATNSVGTSPPSAAVSATPNPAPRPAVASISAVPGTGNVTVNWTAPSGGVAPIGYNITVSPGAFGPFNVSSATFSQLVGGLTAGTIYTFTVTPTHPSPYVGTPASAQASPGAAQFVEQELTVTRPPGALILTQRCGVYNGLPAWASVDAFPGYPRNLGGETATFNQTGTAPWTVWNNTTHTGSVPDSEFSEYPIPSPVTYPTHCGLDLGTASYITGGTLAGQYYTANGRLNEVTVVDTRDNDSGWTVKGTMETFTGALAGNSFSGNYLGWDPEMTDDSDALSSAVGAYNQTVTAGGVVLPGSGIASGSGLGSAGGQTLASAPALSGLGIATLDARVMLLIPSSVNADDYTGTLTITAIETP